MNAAARPYGSWMIPGRRRVDNAPRGERRGGCGDRGLARGPRGEGVPWRKRSVRGFTLVEILVAMAIVSTLAGIAIPAYFDSIERARIGMAIAAIQSLEKDIMLFQVNNGPLPESLDEIGRGALLDPWGNPYRYLNIATAVGKGAMRKDRFLVPLNSDFDLYSAGRDGRTKPPLAAKDSQDDVIRANDGLYVGLAADF